MSKIIDAQDILAKAQGCVECICSATAELDPRQGGPILTVADIASEKITEAIALLDEYRADMGEGPEPAVPVVKPVPPAARARRKGK
jgi:hypothetical protein